MILGVHMPIRYLFEVHVTITNTFYIYSCHVFWNMQLFPIMTMQMKFEHHHHAPIYGVSLNDEGLNFKSFINDDVDHHHCDDKVSHETEPFHIVGRGVPKSNDSTRRKLGWLRSQIIGGSAEFETPFGRRHQTYADHTASGCPLHYIENYITTKLLPFYGKYVANSFKVSL